MISLRKLTLTTLIAATIFFQGARPAQALDILGTVVAYLLDQLVVIETAEKALEEANKQAEIEAEADRHAKNINYLTHVAKSIGPSGSRLQGEVEMENELLMETEKNSYLSWFTWVVNLLSSNEDLKVLASQQPSLSPQQLSEVKARLFSGAGTQADLDLYVQNMSIQVAQPLYRIKTTQVTATPVSTGPLSSAQKNNLAIKRLMQTSRIANPDGAAAAPKAIPVAYSQDEELQKVAEGMAELIKLHDYMQQREAPLQTVSYKGPTPSAKTGVNTSADQTPIQLAQREDPYYPYGNNADRDIDCTPRDYDGDEIAQTPSTFNPLDCIPSGLLKDLGDLVTGIDDVDLGCVGTLNIPNSFKSLGAYWNSCGVGIDFDLGNLDLEVKIPDCPVDLSKMEDINLNKTFVGGPGFIADTIEGVAQETLDDLEQNIVAFPNMYQVTLDAKMEYLYDFYLPSGCDALATPDEKQRVFTQRVNATNDANYQALAQAQAYRPATINKMANHFISETNYEMLKSESLRGDVGVIGAKLDAIILLLAVNANANMSTLKVLGFDRLINWQALGIDNYDEFEKQMKGGGDSGEEAAALIDMFLKAPQGIQEDSQVKSQLPEQACQTPFETSSLEP